MLQTLARPTPATDDEFGGAVAIAGNLVIVGARNDDLSASNAGAIHVFDAMTGQWLHTIPNPDAASNDAVGSAVAISGTTIIAGTRTPTSAACCRHC